MLVSNAIVQATMELSRLRASLEESQAQHLRAPRAASQYACGRCARAAQHAMILMVILHIQHLRCE